MNRDDYVEKMKAQIDRWNAEVAKWEARSREAQTDMRAEIERQLEAYRKQRDDALQEMRRVQDASGEAWKEMMRGAEDSWGKLREAFERAGSHFKK